MGKNHRILMELAGRLVRSIHIGADAQIHHDKKALFVELLREHGIGIASLKEMEARTIAIARGELETETNEPKLWFTSIEALVGILKNRAS